MAQNVLAVYPGTFDRGLLVFSAISDGTQS